MQVVAKFNSCCRKRNLPGLDGRLRRLVLFFYFHESRTVLFESVKKHCPIT